MKWVSYPQKKWYMFGNEDYKFLSRMVLRAPFYSAEAYSAEQLPNILAQQVFRNALLLASPGLYRAIEKKGFRYNELGEKERLTVFKYYNRMSFRPTPFGAFASVSVAGWSSAGTIRFGACGAAPLHLLPSLDAKILAPTSQTRGDIMLAVNPTLYPFGATWRYIKSQTTRSGKLDFSLQSLVAAPLYEHLVAVSGSGRISKTRLAGEIIKATGCTQAEAEKYVAFLVSEQIFLTDDIPGLIERCSGNEGIRIKTGQFLPENGYSFPPDGGSGHYKTPYYAGMERYIAKGGIDPEIQDRLRAVLDVLARIVPSGFPRSLEDFKKAFKSRFDLQKVPLLTALDPDAGISYENLHTKPEGQDPLLGGLSFRDNNAKEQMVEWNAVNRMFLRIWLQDIRRSPHEPVIIKDEDLATLPIKTSKITLPPSLAVLFTRSDGQLIIESAGGATATALVGRFSVFGEEAAWLSREISGSEISTNPDIIFAEIHQRSNNHVDNINRRVQLYDHIIPLNVFPHTHETGHIFPGDLVIAVRNDEIILESKSLCKRVIPRLPTAYNYQHNELALFRFLCDLQYQGLQSNLTFDPEHLFPVLSFYPRFCYRDCVLSLAKWLFDPEHVRPLLKKPSSLGQLHLFRQQHGIPRYISLTQGDQQLVFDLANDQEAFFFLENIRELKSIVIREYLFPDRTLSDQDNLKYAGQYLALLTKEKRVYPGSNPENLPVSATKRHFPPGSEWLYLSIYCTVLSADRVLQQIVSPMLIGSGREHREWFFIRYHDPLPHLRVRIKSSPEQTGMLLSALNDQLNRDGQGKLVRDYKTETYERELERYSAQLIGRVEDLFCAGTAVYIDSLTSNLTLPGRELWPFLFAYRIIERFLDGHLEKLPFLLWVKDSFLSELKADKQLIRELDQKYREISDTLTRLLEDSAGKKMTGMECVQQYLLIIDDLSAAVRSWTISRQENFLCDLVHMEVNRMFISSQRQNEALVYYCLHKYELSRIARKKAVIKPMSVD